MKDKNSFYEALGFSAPWTITSIDLNTKAETVVVNEGIKKKTKIVAKVPRVCYPDGTTGVVSAPWVGTRSR